MSPILPWAQHDPCGSFNPPVVTQQSIQGAEFSLPTGGVKRPSQGHIGDELFSDGFGRASAFFKADLDAVSALMFGGIQGAVRSIEDRTTVIVRQGLSHTRTE